MTFSQPITDPNALLHSEAFLSPLEIPQALDRAFAEDLGRAGDVTSVATIPADRVADAVLVARQGGTIAGLAIAAAAFLRLSPNTQIIAHAKDGDVVAPKTKLLSICLLYTSPSPRDS